MPKFRSSMLNGVTRIAKTPTHTYTHTAELKSKGIVFRVDWKRNGYTQQLLYTIFFLKSNLQTRLFLNLKNFFGNFRVFSAQIVKYKNPVAWA